MDNGKCRVATGQASLPVLVAARTRKNVTSVVLKNTARSSEQTPSVVLENTARSFKKHRSLFWKKNGSTFCRISTAAASRRLSETGAGVPGPYNVNAPDQSMR
jgi:hypothetical protein